MKLLFDNGVLATGLNFPVVPRATRKSASKVSAAHTEYDIDYALGVLKKYRTAIASPNGGVGQLRTFGFLALAGKTKLTWFPRREPGRANRRTVPIFVSTKMGLSHLGRLWIGIAQKSLPAPTVVLHRHRFGLLAIPADTAGGRRCGRRRAGP